MSYETKPYRCRGYLFCNYELLEKNSNQIAKECGTRGKTILRWLRKFNIKVRTLSEAKRGDKIKQYRCRGYLFCMYELLELSSIQIGKECDTNGNTILRWLRKFNIRVRTKSEAQTGDKAPMYGRTGVNAPMYGKTGNKHPTWKGNDVKNLTIAAIHKRLRKTKPKPTDGKCEICNKVKDKYGKTRLELSNIKDHQYTLNPDDYQYAHRSCHNKYDAKTSWTPKRRKELSENNPMKRPKVVAKMLETKRKNRKAKISKVKEKKRTGQLGYYLD